MDRKVAYYITDHGFGHATRAIALIRHLQDKYTVLIRNDNTHDLLRASLSNCKIFGGRTDAGPILVDGGLDMDERKTNRHFSEWTAQFDDIVNREAEFLQRNGVDLVISDISCMPFLAAKKSGIRSVGISNFTWVDILDNFEQNDKEAIAKLEEAYSTADVAIELAGSCGLMGFREKKHGGLLCREVSEPRSEVRKTLGIGEDEIAVFLTFGGSVKFDLDIEAPSNYRIVIPSRLQYSGKAIRLPPRYHEIQNVVGAMDVVVSKAGYGVVSECAQAGVPLLMACKRNSKEDEMLSQLLTELRLGKECSLGSILDGSVLHQVSGILDTLHSSGRHLDNGNINCVEVIDSLLR